MSKTARPAPGARDGTANTGDSPDNASVTSLPPVPPEDSSAATPQPDIVPEPYRPDFVQPDAAGGGTAPGLGVDDEANKVEVETVGEFMLQDPYTLNVVGHEGFHKVLRTSFIEDKITAGQLRVKGE